MPPCSTMGEEMQFLQRWEFRRAESNCDSSSNDESKQSIEPNLKKHKQISLNDEESNENNRLQQQDNEIPEVEAEIDSEKPKKRQTRKRSCNVRNTGRKNGSQEEAGGKSARDLTPLEDLRNFMGSIIEDLTVAREKLSKWMKEEVQKLVDDDDDVDDTPPQPKRRRRGNGETVQQRKKPERKTKGQLQQRKKPEKIIQVEHQTNSEEPVYVPQENEFQDKVEVLPRKTDEIIDLEHPNYLSNDIQPQERSFEKLNEVNNASDFANYYRSLEDGVQYAQANKPRAAMEKSNLQTSPTSQKSVVLAIEAQNCNGGSLERTAKGKKTVDFQVATGAPTSGEKTNREMLGSSIDQNFLSSNQVPSSMYLPLPPALTDPRIANHRLDAMHPGRLSQLIDPNGNSSYFPGKHSQETIRGFAHMGSGSGSGIGCYNQNTMPPSNIGPGFQMPLHHSLDPGFSFTNQANMELLSRENVGTLGLRMNGGGGGGIRYPAANYNNQPEQHYIAHNQHNQSRNDGRFLSYQIPNLRDGNFS